MTGTSARDGLQQMRRSRRRRAPHAARTEDDVVEDDAAPRRRSGEKMKAELDDLLDEIDDVLETNAEDFVKSYVQKGGE